MSAVRCSTSRYMGDTEFLLQGFVEVFFPVLGGDNTWVGSVIEPHVYGDDVGNAMAIMT